MKTNNNSFDSSLFARLSYYGVRAILVLMPFHAFFSVWLGTLLGSVEGVRAWKEALLAAIVCFEAILLARRTDVLKTIAKDTFFRLSLLYIVIAGFMAFYGVHHGKTDIVTSSYAFAQLIRPLVFFMVVATSILLGAEYKKIQKSFIIPAVIVVGFGLLQLIVLPHDFLRHFGYGYNGTSIYQTVDSKASLVRIQSTLLGPNPLGVYLALIGTMVVSLLIKKGQPYKKRLGIFLGALCLCILGSFSRTGVIVFAVSLFVLVLLSCRTQRAKKTFGVALIVLVIAAGGLLMGLRHNDTFQNLVFHTNEKSTSVWSTNEQRIDTLKRSVNEVKLEPFGRGVGTAGPASFRNPIYGPRIAENYYIQLLQEIGFEGLIVFILIIVTLARRLFNRRNNALAAVLFAVLIGLSVAGLFSHEWADDTISYLFFGIAAISLYQRPLKAKNSTKSENTAKLA